MDIGACRHTGVALWIIFLCVSLAVCLSKITASENEPSVFSLIQCVSVLCFSIHIIVCV